MSEKNQLAYIGSAFGVFAFLVMLFLVLAYKLGPTRKPVRPRRDGVEFDLSDLVGPRDLESGDIRDRHHLPDPDMFVIPEEGGESTPATVRSAPMMKKCPMPTVQAVKNDKIIGLELDRDMVHANGRNRGGLRCGAGARSVRSGAVEPVMGGAVLIHGDEDDETLLIPSGAPLPRRKSKRGSKGKGKARELDEDSSSSEPFGLSHFLSPRTGSRAPNLASATVGLDHVFPAMPKPAITRESRGRSTSRAVYIASPTFPWPSGMPPPSRFVVADTDVSSEEENAKSWKPEPPKASRYRGLSATRPGQKPRAPSPLLPFFPVDDAPRRPAGSPPLPAPEAFELGSRRDSWEDFSSGSEAEPRHSSDVDSDEWTSEVFSTVVGPRPDETTLQTANTSTEAGKTETETETGKDEPGSEGKYPVWEHGGPLVPDSRILTQNASLPGRKARFVEVDVDDGPAAAAAAIESPGTASNAFRDCLELLREGARTPTILTDLGYYENKRPELVRGKTWGMSGALFKRRRDEDGGAGEGSSRPQVARSKTSQV